MACALSAELERGRTATQVRGKGPKTEGLACFRNRNRRQLLIPISSVKRPWNISMALK